MTPEGLGACSRSGFARRNALRGFYDRRNASDAQRAPAVPLDRVRGNVVPHRLGEKRPGEGGERRSQAFRDFDEQQLGEIGGVLERDGGVEEIGEERIEREGKKRRKVMVKEGKERGKRGKHDQKA